LKEFNMKKLVIVLAVAIFTNSSDVPGCNGQVEYRTDTDLIFHNIYYDLVRYPGPAEASQLKLYLEVCFDWLLFVKSEDMFLSKYEFSVYIKDDDDNVPVNKSYEKQFALNDYEKTSSVTDFITLSDSYMLEPGDYTVHIEFRDLNAQKSFHSEKKINIQKREPDKPKISDILFVNRFIKDNGSIGRIIPNVERKYNNINKEFYAYFEVLNTEKTGTLKVFYEIENFEKDIVQSGQTEINRTRENEQVILNIGKFDLYAGKYTIYIAIKENGETMEIRKPFLVYWFGVPNTEKDLELALEQMRYIPGAKSAINTMKKLSFEEKRKTFKEYWDKKDPNPDTPQNEFLQGYFNRITNANELFSSSITSQEGWKTDMGMVYILFGPPNEIQRHPFDSNAKPYQVWYYYSINRSFVFVDEIGFGLYRLTAPLSYHEHEVLKF